MGRDASVYLTDILMCIDRIQEYVDGYDDESFDEDFMVQDAVARRIEIIGEAVKGLPGMGGRYYPLSPAHAAYSFDPRGT